MRRRAFIAALGSAAAWPVVAHGHQGEQMRRVGYLYSGSPASPLLLAVFRKGLDETGHIEGQNVTIEYCWANNAFDRLPELAADLVRRTQFKRASLPASIGRAATSPA